MKVEMVPAQLVWPLRERILRPGQNPEKARYSSDLLPSSFHVAYIENTIVGVCSFSLESLADFSWKTPYRLRGMATDFSKQKTGIGRAMLEYSFAELRTRKCDGLWCNARELAFGFYEKMGFEYFGPLFDIADIGPHKVMYKQITRS